MFSKRAGKWRENERQVETETITKSERMQKWNDSSYNLINKIPEILDKTWLTGYITLYDRNHKKNFLSIFIEKEREIC